MNENYCALLKQLGSDLGFGEVVPDEMGNASLVFDGAFLSFSFKEQSGTISMYSAIAQLPEDCPRSILEMLLDEQVFFRGTNGVTLSLSKEEHIVLAQLELLAGGLEYTAFFNAVQSMLHTVEDFAVKIDSMLELLGVSPSNEGAAAFDPLSALNMIRV